MHLYSFTNSLADLSSAVAHVCHSRMRMRVSTVSQWQAMAVAAVALLALVAVVGNQQGAVERLQVLAMGDSHESRPASSNKIEYIGKIPVSSVLDDGLMDRPSADVEHVFCNKDTDPDCENSISPFVDKQAGGQMLVQRTRGNKARKQSLIMPWYTHTPPR